MRLRFVIPAILFVLLGAGFVYALVAIQSGRKDPGTVPSALLGKPAPEFALPAPEGFAQGLSTADLKGKVTVLNVFASWCPPCRVEHPLLLELAKEEGFQVVGLNWKDKDDKLAAWLKEDGNPFARIGADRSGRVGIDWGVYGAPETYILDRDARIVHRHVGPLTKEILRDEIRPLLAKLRK
ncbi:MAG TPA: DsbE family thiol:disulfide interchange protein [Alphaproteobacteria bacterium]|jgi:cytochrome c biogenesis protein CcmG/thiol:disulfide interchange protein DsbE